MPTTSGVSSIRLHALRISFLNPEFWDFRSFDFDRDSRAVEEKFAGITDATNPDLEEFRRLGHKLLYYHGGADPLIPAQNGIDYFESVEAAQSGSGHDAAKTQDFFRAFLVPGLYHCSGGPGAYRLRCIEPRDLRTDADHDVVEYDDPLGRKWSGAGKDNRRKIRRQYAVERGGFPSPDLPVSTGCPLQRPRGFERCCELELREVTSTCPSGGIARDRNKVAGSSRLSKP